MKKIFQYMFIISLLLGVSSMAYAEAPKWKIDPAHAGIYFSIDHIFSKVKGHFNDFDAEVYFDPNNLEQSRAVFTVKVSSIDTNNTKRDGHLQSDDFFSAKKYPNMRFESTAVTHSGDNRYVVDGTMTIKDVSRKVKLPFTFLGTKPNPFNPKQEVAGFELSMTIDRFDYNVGNGKFLDLGVVGKYVDVVISLELTRNI
ncbi:MAG: YceI family protein [Deltaproteobacteria bacterium]|nr:YceI family protein [Deltaproteobacteria bacterium]